MSPVVGCLGRLYEYSVCMCVCSASAYGCMLPFSETWEGRGGSNKHIHFHVHVHVSVFKWSSVLSTCSYYYSLVAQQVALLAPVVMSDRFNSEVDHGCNRLDQCRSWYVDSHLHQLFGPITCASFSFCLSSLFALEYPKTILQFGLL